MSLCRALFVELLPITIRFKCEQRFRHVHYELWMMLGDNGDGSVLNS